VNERISIDPNVQHGRPVIKGTRVPVVRILGELAGGTPLKEICDQYGVTVQDIVAAIEYASELVDARNSGRCRSDSAVRHRRRSTASGTGSLDRLRGSG